MYNFCVLRFDLLKVARTARQSDRQTQQGSSLLFKKKMFAVSISLWYIYFYARGCNDAKRIGMNKNWLRRDWIEKFSLVLLGVLLLYHYL